MQQAEASDRGILPNLLELAQWAARELHRRQYCARSGGPGAGDRDARHRVCDGLGLPAPHREARGTLRAGTEAAGVARDHSGGALHLWLYNTVIVNTFYQAPAQLAAAVVGTPDPVATIDAIWERGGTVAEYLWDNSGLFPGNIGYDIAGAVVWALIGLLCVYTMFLIALSAIALAVLLALGPLFLAMLFFGPTRRFVEAWISQLANYALITILTVLVAALLLQLVASYAEQTAARGGAILTVDALDTVLISVLVFLLMRQVMPIAAALASGVALNTFHAVSRLSSWSARGGAATGVAAATLLRKRGPPAARRVRAALAAWGRSSAADTEGVMQSIEPYREPP